MLKSLHSKIITSIVIAGTLLIVSIYYILYFSNFEKSKEIYLKKMDLFINIIEDNHELYLNKLVKKDPFIKSISFNNKLLKGKSFQDKTLFSRNYFIHNQKINVKYGISATKHYINSLRKRMAFIVLSFYLLVFFISLQITRLLNPFNDIVHFFEQFHLNKENILEYTQPTVSSEFKYVRQSINSISSNIYSFRNKISFMAFYDELTSLPNKTSFEHTVKEKKGPYSLIFINIDKFKLINDTFGHDMGDKVLSIIGSRLLTLPSTNSIFRMGGDEFLIIFDSIKTFDIIKNCQNIQTLISEDIVLECQTINIYSSIGISIIHKKYSLESLKEADLAMFTAKKEGKNNFKFFQKSMKDKIKNKLKLRRAIKESVQNNEFFFVLQPKVNIMTGDIIGAEALIRWNFQGKILSPYYFIKELEKSRFIIDIGYQLIQDIFSFSKTISVPISINIAEKQIEEESFILNIVNLMKETEVDPSLIEFEITERWKSIDSKIVLSNIKSLKDLGFSLSIDDFGEDNSSFKRTDILPIDKIKLDKSFTDRMFSSKSSLNSIHTIFTYSKLSNLDLIVEGVENEEQVTKLKEIGIQYVQGYYFFEPISKEEFKKLVQ